MATANYKIPTLSATDNFDLVHDINTMMNAIDTALHNISVGENPKLEQMQTDISGLKTSVSKLQATLNQLQSTIKSYVKITTYGDLDQYGAITTKEA